MTHSAEAEGGDATTVDDDSVNVTTGDITVDTGDDIAWYHIDEVTSPHPTRVDRGITIAPPVS